jgi:hypothetical protein
MSKISKRDTAPGEGRSVVRSVAPETLHQLIRSRGLEACAELVALATPAQLTSVLDLDLWRHADPGGNEQFDVDRFGEWLEVLVDSGESVAARTIAALDKHLVIAGLSRYLRVFDPGTFEPTESSDDEPIDRHEKMNSETSADVLEYELGGYLVRARRTDAWDAIVALLVTLETDHNHDFHALMQGCRRLSNSTPEFGGLDDLLLAPEQHLHDLAIERERRQSRLGYSTPADARAFLQMARQPRATSEPIEINPIVMAYLRELDENAGADRVRQSDDDPGAMPHRPRALLDGAHDPEAARLPILRRLMEFLRDHDETAYLARRRELAFLTNALVAGSSVQSRAFTAREASEAAACTCNLGLECCTTTPTDAFLVDRDLVTAFEAGWSVLHRDVSLFATDQLVSTLADLHSIDADTERGLRRLRRSLVEQREAGTPWLAREAADVLATLDMTAWISVLGLLDECPVLPAALTAVLERRTTSVSPTAFEFISTAAQIGDVRVFMRALPRVLSD